MWELFAFFTELHLPTVVTAQKGKGIQSIIQYTPPTPTSVAASSADARRKETFEFCELANTQDQLYMVAVTGFGEHHIT